MKDFITTSRAQHYQNNLGGEQTSNLFGKLECIQTKGEKRRSMPRLHTPQATQRRKKTLPRYFPKSTDLDMLYCPQTPFLSGWVAFFVYDGNISFDCDIHPEKLDRNNIAYLVGLNNEQEVVLQLWQEKKCIYSISFSQRNYRLVTKEISSKHGSCVCIKDVDETNKNALAILPVSLPSEFFEEENNSRLIDATQFEMVRLYLFSPFRKTVNAPSKTTSKNSDSHDIIPESKIAEPSDQQQSNGDFFSHLSAHPAEQYCKNNNRKMNVMHSYAPDEQHDTAMHIRFSLDAFIKYFERKSFNSYMSKYKTFYFNKSLSNS